jgi:hypothetical protein
LANGCHLQGVIGWSFTTIYKKMLGPTIKKKYNQFMITLNDNNTAYSADKVNLNCELLPSSLYHNYYKPQAIWKHSNPLGLTLVSGFQDQTPAHPVIS